MMLLLRKL